MSQNQVIEVPHQLFSHIEAWCTISTIFYFYLLYQLAIFRNLFGQPLSKLNIYKSTTNNKKNLTLLKNSELINFQSCCEYEQFISSPQI
jgi:hypothetical protein